MQCESCGYIGSVFRDHCHKTGKIRGKLCNRCNVTLSIYNDDPVTLIARAQVLIREAELIISTLKGDSLYFRLQRTIAEQKIVRAHILRRLTEYILYT